MGTSLARQERCTVLLVAAVLVALVAAQVAWGSPAARATFAGVDGDIYFYRELGKGRDVSWELFKIDPATGEEERLPEPIDSPGREIYPSPSPDGTKLAFASSRTGSFEIYVYDFVSGALTQVTATPNASYYPTWSPDGTRLAFIGNVDGTKGIGAAATDIFVVPASGGDVVNITSGTRSVEWGPVWSPDGTRIAVHSNADGDDEIVVVGADGSGWTPMTDNTVSDRFPDWRPDGQALIFQRTTTTKGLTTHELVEVDAVDVDSDGNADNARTLTADGGAWPSYSPSGTSVVFSRNRAVTVLDLTTGEQRAVETKDGRAPKWSAAAAVSVVDTYLPPYTDVEGDCGGLTPRSGTCSADETTGVVRFNGLVVPMARGEIVSGDSGIQASAGARPGFTIGFSQRLTRPARETDLEAVVDVRRASLRSANALPGVGEMRLCVGATSDPASSYVSCQTLPTFGAADHSGVHSVSLRVDETVHTVSAWVEVVAVPATVAVFDGTFTSIVVG